MRLVPSPMLVANSAGKLPATKTPYADLGTFTIVEIQPMDANSLALSSQEYTELKDFIFELPTKANTDVVMEPKTQPNRCLCRRCQEERKEGITVSLTGHDITQFGFSGMILCELCGNKRCPHATDHRHACTNSNKPGQTGSIFQ